MAEEDYEWVEWRSDPRGVGSGVAAVRININTEGVPMVHNFSVYSERLRKTLYLQMYQKADEIKFAQWFQGYSLENQVPAGDDDQARTFGIGVRTESFVDWHITYTGSSPATKDSTAPPDEQEISVDPEEVNPEVDPDWTEKFTGNDISPNSKHFGSDFSDFTDPGKVFVPDRLSLSSSEAWNTHKVSIVSNCTLRFKGYNSTTGGAVMVVKGGELVYNSVEVFGTTKKVEGEIQIEAGSTLYLAFHNVNECEYYLI